MSRMVRIPTTNASAFYGGFPSANDSAASFGLNPPSGQKDKRRFQARQRHTPGDGVYLVKGCENLLFAIIKKRWQGTRFFLKQGALFLLLPIIRQDRDIIICILIITQRRYLAQVNNSGKV
ncbi:Uncharacterised protein [Klebsiella michiganensis]|uniref:Uncharacterized protein n=2 Tax=Klebsiella michiganensis TaxID=1134687 RepID=A0A7H4LU00_9ENTR|nr:Uncharacterised protein [Klebsiella michiganensis]